MTLNEFAARLIEEVSLDSDRVAAIVTRLAQHGFFGDAAGHPRADEWIRLGWADALALLRATDNSRAVPINGEQPPAYEPTSHVRIPLPDPVQLTAGYDEVRTRRRTHRGFQGSTVSLPDIATIAAWTSSAQVDIVRYFLFDGLAHEVAPEQRFSAFAYNARAHCLTLVKATDAIDEWSSMLWEQTFGDGAPVAVVLAVDWHRCMWRYPTPAAYRWIFSSWVRSCTGRYPSRTPLALRLFRPRPLTTIGCATS
jgi:hypothetical protein